MPSFYLSLSLILTLNFVLVSTSHGQLKSAGIDLKRNSAGEIVEVNLKDVTATNKLATEIAAQAKLVKLTLNKSDMTENGWKSLSKLSNLQQFDLRGCKVSNEQLTASVSGMPSLRALRLNGKSGSSVDDNGLGVLAKCKDLKALAIDHLWVGKDGIQLLTENKRLIELYAAGSLFDDDTLKLLSKFPKLNKIRLAQTSVSGEGLAAIANLPIQDLDLSECSQLDDAALAHVAKLNKLKRLNLWRASIGDSGVEHLGALTELEWLNLDNTQVTDLGLRNLERMQKLSFLHLGSTPVSDAGLKHLADLKSLSDLRVTRTSVTQAGVDAIKQQIAGLKVQLKYIEGK